ncbi:MAG TPA: hypothetical protein VEH29_16810, partial [Acidimicrobiales bacterium]|nr:hypothetical protein [Acidimicrobiales bacterium]
SAIAPAGPSGPAGEELPRVPWLQRRRQDLAAAVARSPGIETTNTVISALAIIGITVFIIWQLRPDLLFSPAMDVGGDNGGHVAAPYFMIHDLLTHGRLTGWDPQWFDGFPLYVFYFPLPALLVGVFNLVFPYAVAFKLVTVLGTVTLPACAWAFGCLAGFRRPVPVLMAAATLPYLFNTSYTIDGGNIASTMAGEFSFSLAMSFGMLFLGVFVYALRAGRYRWLAGVLFAATVLCHIVPGFAFAAVAILFALSTGRLRSLRVLIPVGIVGGLLAAWWLLPFAADIHYSASMGYNRILGVWSNLIPSAPAWLRDSLIGTVILGALIAFGRRDRFASVLAISTAGSGFAFAFLPSGAVYNGRWLPFWFLFAALIAAYGIAELFRGLALVYAAPWVTSVGTVVGTVFCLAGAAQAGGLIGAFPYIGPVGNQIQVQGWINWNYTGFQGKSGWPQWEGMISLMDKAGAKYGCGRLQYEYISETTDPFGSTEAMMAIPLFTNGCMETTDGIYFESSTTTPFHFLDVSEVSQDGEAPDPVSNLNYPGFDLPDGIRHLQFMGVRYFFAMSPPVEAAAAADPSLVKIGQTPGFAGSVNGLPDPHPVWKLYLIKNAPIVSALSYEPVVEPSSAGAWLSTGLKWYEEEQYWPVELTQSGPASWPHAAPGQLVQKADAVPSKRTRISHVTMTDSSISFDVSRVGTPVVIKIPYFPNWQATGAQGPYEAMPNVMVVVPTSHHVTLAYGTTTVDWIGKGASLAGLAGLATLVFRPPADVGPDVAAPEPTPLPSRTPSSPDQEPSFVPPVPAWDPFDDDPHARDRDASSP